MSLRVAIMQPYFFPYGGYYRLFAAADIFVVLDCVQFPRRGWVHRNRLSNGNGEPQWLTLPLAKGDRDTTRICDLRFPSDAGDLIRDQMRRFPCLANLSSNDAELASILSDVTVTPTEYLVRTLELTTRRLGLDRPLILSSSLDIPEKLKAQDRIIEIAKRVNATHYVNAPGGRDLYDHAIFEAAGLSLRFLPDYTGSYDSVLQRMLIDGAPPIAQEILQSTPPEYLAHPTSSAS